MRTSAARRATPPFPDLVSQKSWRTPDLGAELFGGRVTWARADDRESLPGAPRAVAPRPVPARRQPPR
jgi:hypothetical protein